jgi:cobalt-zinc-cadmium efflux system outer membrane protein
MKRWILLLFGLVQVCALPLSAQQSVTPSESLQVGQVVYDVVRHNDRITAMRYMEKAAEAKAKSSGTWDDPMLMVGVANLPTSFDFKMDPMTMKMLGLSQNIPYAGQKGLQKKAAQADATAVTQDRLSAELELATAAKLAFYDLYFSLRGVDLLMKQIEIMQDVVASVKSRVATSQTNPEDAAAAQADLWRLQTQLLPAAHEAESAQYNLNTLRGLPTAGPVPAPQTPTFAELPSNADALVVAAREHYPPLRKLSEQANSYAFSAASARRMLWPMLSLSGSYSFRASTDMEKRDNMVGFQATISLPIFSRQQQRAMAQSMDLMKQSVDAEGVQLAREIETKVRSLYLDALHLTENLRMYRERIIPADEDAYRNAFSGYTNNRTTLATLLNYALTSFRDRLAANQIEYEFARTLAEIERYTTDPAQLAGDQTKSNNQAKDK